MRRWDVSSSRLTRRPPSPAAAPRPLLCHSHGTGRYISSWAVSPAPSKPPASPPVAAPVCAHRYCMGGLQSSCGKSTYNPDTGRSLQTACLQCPANSVTNDTAATSPRHCTCTAGYYNMRSANETVKCFKCPVGSTCAAEGTTLATLPLITGYYRSSNTSSDLRRCPDFGENSGCVGGVSHGEGPCKLGLEARRQHTAHACYCAFIGPLLL
jgi:hypothetical protein